MTLKQPTFLKFQYGLLTAQFILDGLITYDSVREVASRCCRGTIS